MPEANRDLRNRVNPCYDIPFSCSLALMILTSKWRVCLHRTKVRRKREGKGLYTGLKSGEKEGEWERNALLGINIYKAINNGILKSLYSPGVDYPQTQTTLKERD